MRMCVQTRLSGRTVWPATGIGVFAQQLLASSRLRVFWYRRTLFEFKRKIVDHSAAAALYPYCQPRTTSEDGSATAAVTIFQREVVAQLQQPPMLTLALPMLVLAQRDRLALRSCRTTLQHIGPPPTAAGRAASATGCPSVPMAYGGSAFNICCLGCRRRFDGQVRFVCGPARFILLCAWQTGYDCWHQLAEPVALIAHV